MTDIPKSSAANYYEAAHAIVHEMNALFDDEGLAIRPPNMNMDCAAVVSYYTVRATRSFAAVLVLCERGFGVEAQGIVRSMLEDVADVRYIAAQPDVLPAEWVRHESRARYYMYKHLLGRNEPTTPPDDLAELEKVIEEDKQRARESAGEGANSDKVNRHMLKNKWTLLSQQDRVKLAQRKWKDTKKVWEFYPYLCNHAHGSAALSSDYIAHQNGHVVAVLDQDGYKSTTPLTLAVYYASLIFEALTHLGLVHEPRISEVLEERGVDIASLDDLERSIVNEQVDTALKRVF
jgi:hypothetical protein